MAEVKCLGSTLTNQKCMHEEIESRLISRNACYQFAQNISFSNLLSKNLKIKVYRSIILPVVSYGCETWGRSQSGKNKG